MTIKSKVVIALLVVVALTAISIWGFLRGARILAGIYDRRSVGHTLVAVSEEIPLIRRMLTESTGEKHTTMEHLMENVFVMQTAIEMILPEERNSEIEARLRSLLADLTSISIIVDDIYARLENRELDEFTIRPADMLRLAQMDSMVERVKEVARIYDASLVAETARVQLINRRLAFLFVASLILSATGGVILLVRDILRPVARIQTTMHRISTEGDYLRRVEGRYSGEFGQLASAFNDMTERLSGMIEHLETEVAERELAEAALSEAYRIINRSPTVAFLWKNEESWPVQYASENVEELFGYSAEQFISGEISYSQTIHPDDLARVTVEVESKSSSRTATAFEHDPYRINTKDGDTKWVEDKTHIRRDPDGKITHFEGVVYDITERRVAEMEHERLQAELNQALKIESIGRLAGGVAHDFNNMLGVILGHTELAMKQVDEKNELHSNLEEIRQAAERSAALTRQLLAFARKQTILPRVLDLNHTVEGMLTMLRRLIGEGIDLAWVPGDHLWQITMDPSQIDQLIANLCVNARDAIGDFGRISIETANARIDEEYCRDNVGFVPGDYVRIAVSDDGCGMDKKTLDELFEPFFTTKESGTGLGLSTVYGIVKQNDGFINVYSEPGQGTTFKIYLARTDAAGIAAGDGVSEEAGHRGNETILVTEDEPALLKMAGRMLETEGYTVIPAGTPSEALRLADEHAGRIHMLMTDVVMPEMNGRDLAEMLTARYPDMKCLFMSGYTANVIAHRGIVDRDVNFIQKPFSMKELAAKVSQTLGGKRQA